MNKESQVSITVRIDKNIHKKCKAKLVEEECSFVELVRKAVKEYVEGNFKI